MRFPFRLLLAMLIAGPAATLHAQAEPAQDQPPPDPSPEEQIADKPVPQADASGDEVSADSQAEADSVQSDSSAAGEPPYWLFVSWCPAGSQGNRQMLGEVYAFRADRTVTYRAAIAAPRINGRWTVQDQPPFTQSYRLWVALDGQSPRVVTFRRVGASRPSMDDGWMPCGS